MGLEESRNPDTATVEDVPGPGLMDSLEGSILLAGLLLTLVSILGVGLTSFEYPEESRCILGMSASHMMFGRVAGMMFGYTLGYGHLLVVPVNLFIETVMVLIFYPLFVFSWRKVLIIPALRNLMDRVQGAAEMHQDKIRRYGVAGVFFFVWLPFWMTGPLVGCVIGFFIGLRPLVNVAVVLGGTYMAIFTYAIALKELHDQIYLLGHYAPLILLGAIILVVVIVGFVTKIGNRK